MADSKHYPPLAALRAFEAVGRLGGIRRAARELGIDHAVVSRHIRSLETWVGTSLVIRKGADSILAESGAAYHEEIAAALAGIASATGKLMRVSDALDLKLWCIPGFAFLWLADRLGDFMTAHPEVHVDFRPSDHSPDFRAKQVDGDIRYLRDWEVARLPRMIHRFEFARPPVLPVASPAYLSSMPPITCADDLLGHRLLHEEDDMEWLHWLKAQGVDVADRLPGSRLWHAHLTLNAARRHQGIALANKMLLRDDIERGRLIVVEPIRQAFSPVRFAGYTLIAREDRWNAPALACFRRWLQRTATPPSK